MNRSCTAQSIVVALVGHSAAGKSACILHINGDHDGDMDVALGYRESPTFTSAVEWLTHSSRPPVVAVSNHEKMLQILRFTKLSGEYAQAFGAVYFVYLHKPMDRLKRHLARPRACGTERVADDRADIVQHYDRFHALFTDLADVIVDCSKGSVMEIAERVRTIAGQVQDNRLENER